jgi:outer membrane biogenesis lipoprotein LolB
MPRGNDTPGRKCGRTVGEGLIAPVFVLFVFLIVQGCSFLASQDAKATREPLAWSTESLYQSLMRRERELKSLRSLGTVSYVGRGEKGSFQSVIALERPNKIRVEAHSPFGAVWIVTYNGRELVRLDARSGVRQRGEGTEENLAANLKLPLRVEDLTAILMGLPPKRDLRDSSATPAYDAALRATRITRPLLRGGEQRIWFASPEEPPVRIEEENSRGISFRADFHRPEEIGGLSFPTEISLAFPKEGIGVRVLYKAPDLNPSLSGAVFEQNGDSRIPEVPF